MNKKRQIELLELKNKSLERRIESLERALGLRYTPWNQYTSAWTKRGLFKDFERVLDYLNIEIKDIPSERKVVKTKK